MFAIHLSLLFLPSKNQSTGRWSPHPNHFTRTMIVVSYTIRVAFPLSTDSKSNHFLSLDSFSEVIFADLSSIRVHHSAGRWKSGKRERRSGISLVLASSSHTRQSVRDSDLSVQRRERQATRRINPRSALRLAERIIESPNLLAVQ